MWLLHIHILYIGIYDAYKMDRVRYLRGWLDVSCLDVCMCAAVVHNIMIQRRDFFLYTYRYIRILHMCKLIILITISSNILYLLVEAYVKF